VPLFIEAGSIAGTALTELGFAQRSRRGRSQEPSQGSWLIAARTHCQKLVGTVRSRW